MNSGIAETVKLFFLIMIIGLLLNVIALGYRMNQMNSFVRQANEYIRQEGALDAQTKRKINTLVAQQYKYFYLVEDSDRQSVTTNTNSYTKDQVDNAIALQGHDDQLFNKDRDLIKPDKKYSANSTELVKADKYDSIDVPIYKVELTGTKTYINATGKAKHYIRASNDRYIEESHYLANDQVHPYGSPIYYNVHMRLPLIQLGAFKSQKIVIDHTWQEQIDSQTDNADN